MILFNNSFDINKHPARCPEAIDCIVNKNGADKQILIVPTGKIVRHHQFDIIRKYYLKHGKPFSQSNVYTFQTFTRFCFDKLFNRYDYHLISDAYRLALFEEASAAANLKFFRKSNDKMSSALLSKLAEVIIGLKEDGIEPPAIFAEISNPELAADKFKSDMNRLNDIYALYTAYQQLLGDRFLDFPDLLKKTTNKIAEDPQQAFSKIFGDGQFVLLDGFTEFKKPETEFLSLFSNCGIPFAINIDYDDAEGPLYTILENSIMMLGNAGFNIHSDKAENKSNHRLDFLKLNLFSISNNRSREFSGILKIIETPTLGQEIEYITKLVKHLIIKENFKPSDICIALRQTNKYSLLFRESFFLHKIPVNITDRFQLDKSPVTVAVFSILDLLHRGYRTSELKKSLMNPYITIPSVGDDFDLDNLLAASSRLRMNKIKTNDDGLSWTTRFDAKIAMLEKKLQLSEEQFQYDLSEVMAIKSELLSYRMAKKDFSYLINQMPQKTNIMTANVFCDFIRNDILERFAIKKNIIQRVDSSDFASDKLSKQDKILILENIEKDSRAYNSLNEIIDEMEFILNERQKGMKFRFEELLTQFKTAVTGKKYQISEKSGFGVTVTSIEQTRQIPFKVMILCGAVDGEFPVPYKPEAFLGKELPGTEERHILSERMQFYQFLANYPELTESGDKRIFISYPKFNQDRELVRSPFVDALLNITTLEKDDCIICISTEEKNAELAAKYPWILSVSSNSEQQRYFAQKLIDDKSTPIDSMSDVGDISEQIADYLKFVKERLPNHAQVIIDNLPAEIKENLRQKADLPVSISELEAYASCPFKYFVKYILKLKEAEEVDLSISNLEMGNILHRVLFEFFTEEAFNQVERGKATAISPTSLQLPQIMPVELSINDLEKYSSKLLKLAEKHIMQIKFDHPLFSVDMEQIMGSSSKIGLLNIWLNGELERINKGWRTRPGLFEFAFGMKSYSNMEVRSVELEGLKVKGKIDRIEFDMDKKLFFVSDYKLSESGIVNNSDINNGLSFQIPIYLLAAEQILDDYKMDFEPGGGFYYIFKSKNGSSQFKSALTPKNYKIIPSARAGRGLQDFDELRNVLDNSLVRAKEIVDKISNGIFDITPVKGACDYCSFSAICRVKGV